MRGRGPSDDNGAVYQESPENRLPSRRQGVSLTPHLDYIVTDEAQNTPHRLLNSRPDPVLPDVVAEAPQRDQGATAYDYDRLG